jgi:FAD/FMN-containing dehydrogenase
VALLTPTPGIIGRVLRRTDEGYEHYRRGTCWHDRVPPRYPEAIVIATSDDDVVGAVKLARREGLGIAVRSGGHSWAASHLRDNTVLIDMSNMRRVEIDRGSMTGVVQPGIKGSELTEMLAAEQLYFPTGHNAGISLGGYLLQGGFAWAGRDYGPACMSVIGIDAVTADGELVHADETENADLLWAARGAGPGFFAVVTSFTVRLYPRRKVTMASTYVFPIECLDDVAGFLHEIGTRTPLELSVVVTRLDIAGGEPAAMLAAVAFTDTEEEAREQLALIETVPGRERALSADLNRLTDHMALTRESQEVIDESMRWVADNIFTRARYESFKPVLDEMIADWPPAPSHLVIANWSGREGEPERPSMAFSIEDELYYAMYAAWRGEDDDQRYIDWVTDHMRAWEPHATGTMLADENLQHRPSRFVTDENLARLDELRATWDPRGAFVSWLGRPEL